MTYFEDVFAKSSLLGYEAPTNSNINKNDLEEFQKNLLLNINQRLFEERELDIMAAPENSLEIIPASN